MSRSRSYPLPESVGAKRTRPGGEKQKWFLSPQGRDLMIELYDSSSERITELVRRLGVPRPIVIRWARKLGLSKSPQNVQWTKEQVVFLKKNIHAMPLAQIAKHLKKGTNTVREKAIDLGFYRRDNGEGYTLSELMLAFGMKGYDRIGRWISNGWLKGKKKRTGVNNETWSFTVKDVRNFVFAHPEEVEYCKEELDLLWLIDILSGDNGIGRLDGYDRPEYFEEKKREEGESDGNAD